MTLVLGLLGMSVAAAVNMMGFAPDAPPQNMACRVCEHLAQHMQKRLAETAGRDEIINVGHRIDDLGNPLPFRRIHYRFSETRLADMLEGACEGSPNANKCHELLTRYGKEIADWLVKNEAKAPFIEAICFEHVPGCSKEVLKKADYDPQAEFAKMMEHMRAAGEETRKARGRIEAVFVDILARIDKSPAGPHVRKLASLVPNLSGPYVRVRTLLERLWTNRAAAQVREHWGACRAAAQPYLCPTPRCWPVVGLVAALSVAVAVSFFFPRPRDDSADAEQKTRARPKAKQH
jgi:hypothetical protein